MQARARSLILAAILAALAVAFVGACDPYMICFEPGESCPGDFENTCTAAEGAYVCAPSCSDGDGLPCPFPETGDGVPACVADPITGRGVCVLTCDEATQCPESMGCLEGFCAGFQT